MAESPHLLANVAQWSKNSPAWRQAAIVSLLCGCFSAINAAFWQSKGIDTRYAEAAAITVVLAIPLFLIFRRFFTRFPELTTLSRFFTMVSVCLPGVFLSAVGFAINTYGQYTVLDKNKEFSWANYVVSDIFLTLPVFVFGAIVCLAILNRPKAPAPKLQTDNLENTLRKDWGNGFWIEPVAHANIGVIAGVVMGTGALANQLALWFTMWFLIASVGQLLFWPFVRKSDSWIGITLSGFIMLFPFHNWGRFPILQEHGPEAVGGGLGMWTIALLATAILSARRIRIVLTVLCINTVFVTVYFYQHQHADGWFEQSTIAAVLGSFSLIVALAAHGIYRERTVAQIALQEAVVKEQEARARAIKETERRRRILRAIGHDLRQPLSALQLWLYTAGRKNNDGIEDLDAAMASVSSAHEILESISQYAWLVDGEKEPKISPIYLPTFVEEIAAETRTVAQASTMEIRHRSIDETLYTDPLLLKRIIRNFVVNAIKHGGHGKVLIAARRRGKNMEVLVFDQGQGISSSAQQRIFEEFEQTDDNQSAEGIGVGLAVAKDLSDALGYQILLASKEGAGSMFGVSIPPRAR